MPLEKHTGPVEHEAFHELAHRIFTRAGNGAIKQVAADMGFEYNKLYSRFRGTASFRPEEIKCLFLKYDCAELIEYFTANSGYFLAPRPKVKDCKTQSIRHAAVQAVMEVASILGQVEESLSGDKMNYKKRELLLREINLAEGSIASLRAIIES